MQLEPAPVELEVIGVQQPDQTGLLGDVAEGSDEVGVEAEDHRFYIVQEAHHHKDTKDTKPSL
jgi:hypothetical protein